MMKLLQFRKMCDVHFHMQPMLEEKRADETTQSEEEAVKSAQSIINL